MAEMDVYLAEDIAAQDRLVMLNNASIIRAGRGEPVDDGLGRNGTDRFGHERQMACFPGRSGGELGTRQGRAAARHGTRSWRSPRRTSARAPSTSIALPSRRLWAEDVPDATELLARLVDTGAYGPVFEARLATLRAGIAALEGRPKDAMALYREALSGWRATNHVWDEALTGVTMAQLLDSGDPEVADVISTTRSILERLGAKPYLDRLDAAAGACGPTAGNRNPGADRGPRRGGCHGIGPLALTELSAGWALDARRSELDVAALRSSQNTARMIMRILG